MTIEQIGEEHRVPVKRDECGDQIIPGKNGHLYVDEGKPFVCFTDDGRKKPLTTRMKTAAFSKLSAGLLRVKQEGDAEFIGELNANAISVALFRVLGVKRFKVTKGIPKPLPEGLRKFHEAKLAGGFTGKKGNE